MVHFIINVVRFNTAIMLSVVLRAPFL